MKVRVSYLVPWWVLTSKTPQLFAPYCWALCHSMLECWTSERHQHRYPHNSFWTFIHVQTLFCFSKSHLLNKYENLETSIDQVTSRFCFVEAAEKLLNSLTEGHISSFYSDSLASPSRPALHILHPSTIKCALAVGDHVLYRVVAQHPGDIGLSLLEII